LDKKEVTGYLKANRFPKKYNADKVISMVWSDEITPKALVEFTEDANSLLFDTPVIGAEVYKSMDNGMTWTKTHEGFLDGVYNSYGYYFGQIRASAHKKGKLYIMGVPVMISEDDGATWTSINGDNVHADHHALYVSPHRDKHLILGNDGGINISYDDGKHWNKCNTPALGQFYDIEIDEDDNYQVYGGLQDNGVWVGPHTYTANTRWHGTGQYPYKALLGGDGMQVQVDPRDKTVYTGFQFGNYFRINPISGQRKRITPMHELGEAPNRWNWQTPIQISKHNPDIIYFGSQYLHRSFDRGDKFEPISSDLTSGGKKGDVAFGTLTAIDESPIEFGMIYTGSDDGMLHVTPNGGYDWENINQGLPQDMWISRVVASKYAMHRVYVTLNGYRWDDMKPYVYVSEDMGKTWFQIATDLPLEPVNVIAEDPNNDQILYIGTDHGLYVSMDRGKTTMLMNNQLPAVPVHDVEIHAGQQHLLVGTHGRSIYKADIQHLQSLNAEKVTSSLLAFEIDKVNHSSRWGGKRQWWQTESTAPKITLPIFTNTGGSVSVKINDKDGNTIKSFKADTVKGINYIDYDLSRNVLKSRKRLVLSFNLLWKRKFQNQPIRNITTTDIAINIVILLIGATVLTISRQIYSPEFLDKRELFFSSLISYFIIQLNLLLIARVVNLNLEYQKDIFEKEQIKQRALQHQLQALRTQVNPHFLFNALNSLNALIRQKSDNALTFVDKLSYLLRSTLQQSEKSLKSESISRKTGKPK